MARKLKAQVTELKSWEDVDRALREIGECEIGIESLEANMNMKINDAKVEAEKLGKPLKNAIAVLAGQIEEFVCQNRDGLEGKSRTMNFGIVGYRQSSRVTYSTRKTEEILEKLKQYNMLNCINVKETINKEALERYPERDIKKVGAQRKVEDRFYLEADREKIRG